MRVALISLCRGPADGAGGYCGLFPIGNDSLLAYQIGLAARAGASKLLCHVDSVPGDLMRHEKLAQALGLEWVTIRQFGDLLAQVMDDDELLVIGDGVFHAAHRLDSFMENAAPAVLVAAADDAQKGLERLDLNHLWAGLLHIKRDHLDELNEVPAEWSLESVLLRAAMKTRVQSVMIPAKALETRSVMPVEAAEDAKQISLDLLKSAELQDHPLSSYLVRPLAAASAPWIWAKSERALWMMVASVALLTIMLPLLAVQWSIAGIVCGYGGYLAGRIVKALDSPAKRLPSMLPLVPIMVIAAAIGIGIFLTPSLNITGLAYIALIWLMLQGLSARSPSMSPWMKLVFDPALLAILAIATSLFGYALVAIAILTLAQLANLLAHNVRDG